MWVAAKRNLMKGVKHANFQVSYSLSRFTNSGRSNPTTPGASDQVSRLSKQEAQELAQLSAGIPPRINSVAKGQLPKDLADHLERIEELAKQMRSEILR